MNVEIRTPIKMKKLIIILLGVFLFGCTHTPQKPFVITAKAINYSGGKCKYIYCDKTGYKEVFFETNDKYNIGDTIY